MCTGIWVVLDEKDFKCMNNVLPFVATLINRDTGCIDKAPVTVVHSEYSAPVILVMYQERFSGQKAAELALIREKVEGLKRSVVKVLPDHCGNELFVLMFDPPIHLEEYLRSFESMETLDVSPFRNSNVHVKNIYCHPSQRLSSSMSEMAEVMKDSVTARSVRMSTKGRR